jgi:hypothetical protein
VIELFGLTIHDPDVVFTDLGLAFLGAFLSLRLRTRDPGQFSGAGAALMAGLASAAFWGAVFHGFFPAETETTGGFVAWIPVVLSIIVAAGAMLNLALRLLTPSLPFSGRRIILVTYTLSFLAVVLLVDESFTSIVRFYVPVLLLFLMGAARQALGDRRSGWGLVTGGLLLSVAAAVLQQAQVVIHPDYFDHNALYHVVQAIALLVLYLGFRRISDRSPSVSRDTVSSRLTL